MCGIVGYIGDKNCFPILIKGLQRLEYRGYDSAGVAVFNGTDEIQVKKKKERSRISCPLWVTKYLPAPWASDTPDGPHTDHPMTSTPTRIPHVLDGSP